MAGIEDTHLTTKLDEGNTEDEVLDVEDLVGDEKGIDVSHWQGQINWGTVAEEGGVKHVFIKMSEGATGVDKNFGNNWKSAKEAGMNVNCYHYFRALAPNSQEQEQYIVSQKENIKKSTTAVTFDPAKSLLAIDVEEARNGDAKPKEMADNLEKLLELIGEDADLREYRVMIYTSPRYWNTRVDWRNRQFENYPLWVANYNVPTPTIPKPWKDWTWWQYSNKGNVPGISGHVDLNWTRTSVRVAE